MACWPVLEDFGSPFGTLVRPGVSLWLSEGAYPKAWSPRCVQGVSQTGQVEVPREDRSTFLLFRGYSWNTGDSYRNIRFPAANRAPCDENGTGKIFEDQWKRTNQCR